MNKTISNIIYNALYQALVLILPFITMPYVSRVLGSKAIGINAYINSIPYLLSPIILFGLTQYGAKMIATSSKEDLSKDFFELWLIQLIAGATSIILFIFLVVFFLDYKILFITEIPFLVGYILDVSWFYVGRGEIKTVVLRNTIIKLVIVLSIFIFVHSPNDLWKYLIINSAVYLANIAFWLDLKKQIDFKAFKYVRINLPLLKNSFLVLLPTLAVQFYISFDQTLVKWLAGSVQLAYYSQSQTLTRGLISAVGSISTIMMPKLAKMTAEGADNEEVNLVMKNSLDGTMIVAVTLFLLIFTNSSEFVVWFWGNNFAPMGKVLALSSFIILFVSFGSVFANQYAMANGLLHRFAVPYYVGVMVSVVLNIWLVPHFKAFGAAFVICITEFVVMLFRYLLVAKYINSRVILRNQSKIFGCTVVAAVIGIVIPSFPVGHFLSLCLRSLVVIIVFGVASSAVNYSGVINVRFGLKSLLKKWK